MTGILGNFLKPDNADRMALAFNQLRLDPDPNLAGIIQNRQALRQQQMGRDAAMKYFEGKPGAGGYMAALGAGGDGPATIQSYLSARSAAAGRPPKVDRNASIALMQKKCDEGDQDACQLAGMMVAGGNIGQLMGIYYQGITSGKAVQQTKDLGRGLTKTTYKNSDVKYFQHGVELQDATAIQAAIQAENEFDITQAKEKAGAKRSGVLLSDQINETAVAIKGVSNRIASTTPLLQKLYSHPGLKDAVGNLAASKRGANSFGEGHAGREFITLFDQLSGIIFLAAFQGLKGGGAITEAEGDKAARAASNISRALSVTQFQDALQRYMDSLTNQHNRLVSSLADIRSQLSPTAADQTNLEVEF